ncbi:unannotated protein [freshwater metagenome]|uniref:Unannotated protein n=1 Tax=freshwater metagenome TaxID=449393 RepID=A0A6J7KRE0_9ZZZZ|nr:molecular chaperone DnaK [Actinomycetota bacterium]
MFRVVIRQQFFDVSCEFIVIIEMMQSKRKHIIGIDLGTSRSLVAVFQGGQPKVIPTASGDMSVPSVVAFDIQGTVLVGVPAWNQRALTPSKTVYGAKRLIGRRFDEMGTCGLEVDLAYRICETEVGRIGIGVRKVSAELVSAVILDALKRQAEDFLGENVTRAIITVPAYFNDAQRHATKIAGEVAGLEVVRIINEPIAAALAYGLEKKTNAKVAVFDLGGGTFNVSILDISDGVFEVLSTAGDSGVGGEALTDRLARHVAQEFTRDSGIDLRGDSNAMHRIRDIAETAKVGLSSLLEVTLRVPAVALSKGKWIDLEIAVTRLKFEELCKDLFERVTTTCQKVLADAKLSPSDVQEIVMVGGSVRIAKVQELAKKVFHTGTVVKGINPDEVVAIGAAIQGGVLMGDVKNVVLLDVTPFSIGVETLGGAMTKLIERNTIIPISKKEIFSTTQDNQKAVTIVVLEGERQMAADNRVLGRFDLQGIAAAPRGVPQLEVEFSLDCNGILNVMAAEKATGKKQEIQITGSSGISKDEVGRMQSQLAEITRAWRRCS